MDALRADFFNAIDDVEPEVALSLGRIAGPLWNHLQDLWGELLRLERDVTRQPPAPNSSSGGELAKMLGELAGERLARLMEAEPEKTNLLFTLQEEFSGTLISWASPYNLHRDTWILDDAKGSLERFRLGHPILMGLRGSNPDSKRTFASEFRLESNGPPSVPEPLSFRPDLETRPAFHRRVARYVSEVEEGYRAAGWEPPPHTPTAFLHLHWLVRFQVGGETTKSIASHEADVRTVERALKRMSELIGLTRRSLEAAQFQAEVETLSN